MANYTATVEWQLEDATFLDNRYSRRHRWLFDGGVTIPASSSPLVVPVPMSDPSAVDPEEAFIASLASCHMLWFLSVAAKRGYIVAKYRDQATGVMSRGADGRLAMTSVTLHPEVIFSGDALPSNSELQALHHAAHENCFIAASVKSEIRCEPVFNHSNGASPG